MARPILYSAWFCPFAQRSWIALLHKNIDFEYREQNPYDKSPEWLAINPKGLVPALAVGSHVVIESEVINEYIDEAWPGIGNSLFPPMNEPFRRAQSRLWMDFINKKLIAPVYKLLPAQGKSAQDNVTQEIVSNIRTFAEGMDSEGPFFQGRELGIVDIAYIPWMLRLYILKEFRGFEVPTHGLEWKRFHEWCDAASVHPSVTPTMQDRDKLLASHKKLIDSMVATTANKS